MTSSQVQCFMSAAEHLNFSKAAAELFMAQSSLSKNILNLELELGIKLFIRTKKYVKLTPSGAVLYEEFKKLTAQYEKALKKAMKVNLDTESSIHIGILEAQKTDIFLPKAIANLKKMHLSTQIHFTRANFKSLRELLFEDSIDIAITLGFDLDEFDLKTYEIHKILSFHGKCFISAYHPLTEKESLSFQDLKNETLIAISPEISKGGYERLLIEFEIRDALPKNIQTVDSIENIMLLVESGLGISILDENCIIYGKSSIKHIPIKENSPTSLVAIWKKSNINPVVPMFINALM